jgi:hypothetical protein
LYFVLTRLLCHTLHKKSTLEHEKRPHIIVVSSPHFASFIIREYTTRERESRKEEETTTKTTRKKTKKKG